MKWLFTHLVDISVGALFVGLVAGVMYFQAKMESDAFNRATGANTSWHEALWVELRVQGTAESK